MNRICSHCKNKNDQSHIISHFFCLEHQRVPCQSYVAINNPIPLFLYCGANVTQSSVVYKINTVSTQFFSTNMVLTTFCFAFIMNI